VKEKVKVKPNGEVSIVDPKYWTAWVACICYGPPPLSPP
jgi:hypothetical protein